MSAQATDKSVNLATAELFKVVRTPQELIHLGEKNLITYIKSIGLYKTKAKNLILMAKTLESKFTNIIPDNEKDLLSLAGVGLKTAGVILNTLYNQPTIAVDTHVFRVCNRMGIAKADSPEKLTKILPSVIPPKFHQHAHHWLILHGRYVCVARKPKCETCNVREYCDFRAPSKIAKSSLSRRNTTRSTK